MVWKTISDTWGYVPRTTQNIILVQVLFITGMRSGLFMMWPRLCGAASKKMAMAHSAAVLDILTILKRFCDLFTL